LFQLETNITDNTPFIRNTGQKLLSFCFNIYILVAASALLFIFHHTDVGSSVYQNTYVMSLTASANIFIIRLFNTFVFCVLKLLLHKGGTVIFSGSIKNKV